MRPFAIFLAVGLLPGVTGLPAQQLRDAKIGDSVTISEPAGDGCNSCSRECLKLSETQAQCSNFVQCTLLNCLSPFSTIDIPPYEEAQ